MLNFQLSNQYNQKLQENLNLKQINVKKTGESPQHHREQIKQTKMTSAHSGRGLPSGRLLDSYLQSDGNLPSTSRSSAASGGSSEDPVEPLNLNSNSCLSLEVVTESFSGPIKEEHAWAIIFECCKCLQKVFAAYVAGRQKSSRVYLVTDLSQVFIHRDGRIHESTFLKPETPSGKNELSFTFFLFIRSLSNHHRRF